MIGFGFFDVTSVARYNQIAGGPTQVVVCEDDFEAYTTQTIPGDASTTLVAGSGWDTSGFVLPPAIAIVADESFEAYTADVIPGDGSATLVAGTGWASAGFVLPPTAAIVADESFESYGTGTSGSGLSGGTGWNGNSVIF